MDTIQSKLGRKPFSVLLFGNRPVVRQLIESPAIGANRPFGAPLLRLAKLRHRKLHRCGSQRSHQIHDTPDRRGPAALTVEIDTPECLWRPTAVVRLSIYGLASLRCRW